MRTPTPRGLRILVADDNRDAADSLALLLELVGHTVAAAYDGPSALETAGWFAPDACLLDLHMKRMDGLEVARRLRAAGLLLVAVTGLQGMEDQCHAAGFDRVFLKPAAPDDLFAALAEFAGGATGGVGTASARR